MTERRHAAVANVDEVEAIASKTGTKLGYLDKRLGAATGGKQLGCSYYEIEPGRAAFPKHFHCANEEAVFVLEGEGALHLGNQEVALRKGDYAAFVVGPEHAHKIVNTGESTLKYLCFSTMLTTEVVGYPDSKKVGVRAGASSETAFSDPWVREIVMAGSKIGYFDGEDVG